MAFALVTGASTGIGRELAKIAAKSGYDVIVTARNLQALEGLRSEIESATDRRVLTVAKDLAQLEAPRELYEELAGVRSEIDILINNAGFGLQGLFTNLDEHAQMQMVQLNCGALTHLARLFGADMVARGRGYILNVASTAAFQPGPLMAVYYATKAYVLSLSAALYNEMKDFGVSVTALCPGPTRTEFQERAGVAESALFKGDNVMSAEQVASIGFRAMMNRKPEVVAGTMNALMAFLTRFSSRQMAASIARKMQET